MENRETPCERRPSDVKLWNHEVINRVKRGLFLLATKYCWTQWAWSQCTWLDFIDVEQSVTGFLSLQHRQTSKEASGNWLPTLPHNRYDFLSNLPKVCLSWFKCLLMTGETETWRFSISLDEASWNAWMEWLSHFLLLTVYVHLRSFTRRTKQNRIIFRSSVSFFQWLEEEVFEVKGLSFNVNFHPVRLLVSLIGHHF